MSKYLAIQKQVDTFSNVFGLFILFTTSLVFVMCLLLFYGVIRQGVMGVVNLLVYLGNGAQILTR
jgi:hypothetical protein